MEPDFRLRDALDADEPALIRLIGGVFDEYPGCVLDVDGEIPELRRIASAFAEWGGAFWVVERPSGRGGGVVVACVGYKRASEGRGIELCKLYVAADARRHGLGGKLCARVEAAVPEAGFVDLWSDTRFADAHRLYEKRGYVRGPETRELRDKSDTVEFYYRLERP